MIHRRDQRHCRDAGSANANTLVARLTSLAPGRWLIMFSAELNWVDPGAMYGTCVALVNGQEVAGTNVIIGASGGDRDLPVAAFGVIDRSSATDPFDVTLQCRHDTSTSGHPQIVVSNRSLAAIRVDSLNIG
jgi:hypothetical protein